MLRRLLAALLVVVAFFSARSASAADPDAKPPTIDLYTIGAGDYFYARFGHTLLCVRPAGSDIADLGATCYDYGVPSRQEFLSIGWGAVRNKVDFVPIVVPEKTVVEFFKGQGRAVERQHIPLVGDEAAALAKRLSDDVDQKVGYAYHPYWRNCTTALRDHLDAATKGRLHAGPFTPAPGKFREIFEEGLSGRLVELTLMALVLGSPENNRVPTGWESMFLPMNLRDGVRDRLGAPIEKLSDRQAVILPTSRAIGRIVLFFLAFVLFVSIRISLRRKRLKTGLWISGVTLGFLGTFLAIVSALVAWPEISHNWALALLLPTDFALPFLLKRKKLLVTYARVRIGMALVLAVLEFAGVIAQPVLPLVALVLFPFVGLLGAVRTQEEEADQRSAERVRSSTDSIAATR
jgi:hypothetical protein